MENTTNDIIETNSTDIDAENQTRYYIQESFIKESHGSVSDDYARSDKRMIDHTINLEAMKYISEFLDQPSYSSFEEASKALAEKGYQLVAEPTKLEYGKYNIRFDILEAIASKSVLISLKSDINVENV